MIPIPQFVFRRLAKFLIDYPHITDKLFRYAQRHPYSHITSRDGSTEYMRRWWLFNPYSDSAGKRKYPWIPMSIRFHEILRADDDPHLHDHPWDAQTIIVRGWYIEEVETPGCEPYGSENPDEPPVRVFMREAGYTAPIRFGQYHRIREVSHKRRQQTLTLFFTFGYRGTWGFKVDGVKVPWREYLADKHAGDSAALRAMHDGAVELARQHAQAPLGARWPQIQADLNSIDNKD